MNFLSKIEDFINHLMLKLGGLMLSLLKKLTPPWLAYPLQKMAIKFQRLMNFLKQLPQRVLENAKHLLPRLKAKLLSHDFRSQMKQTYQTALESSKRAGPKGVGKLRTALFAPFLVIGHWLRGLSAAQTFLLLSLTGASVLAGMNIVFSSQRIAKQLNTQRAPASVEEELKYERPDYYKRETRHLLVSNLRLPVYFPKLNAIKTVDIDFTATLSNRFGRLYLEKMEWQLRDHLILEMEPIVADFSLEEEGKEVLRIKLADEVDNFLRLNKVDARVEVMELTYILAN